MVDFATLDMRIDSTEVDTGVKKLDSLTAAGAKAEGAVDRLGKSMDETGRSTKKATEAADDYTKKILAQNAATGVAGTKFGTAASALGGFARGLGIATLAIGGVVLVVGALAAALAIGITALKTFNSTANDDEIKKYAASLGLTAKEMKRLDDVGITAADSFKGLYATLDQFFDLGDKLESLRSTASDVFDTILKYSKMTVAGIYAGFVGAYTGIVATWRLLPSIMGEIAIGAANAVISGLEFMINKAISGINILASGANNVLAAIGVDAVIGQISEVTLGRVKNAYSGSGKAAGAAFANAASSAYDDAIGGMDSFSNAFDRNTVQAAKDRLREQANDIIGGRPDQGGAAAAKEKTKALSEQEKAYQAALKAAQAYVASLDEETAKIGKNAIEIKRMEIATAVAAAEKGALSAATDKAKQAILAEAETIKKSGAAWEAATRAQADADFQTNIIDPLTIEVKLLGLVGTARDRAALALEETAFKADLLKKGIADVNGAWEQYLNLQTKIIDDNSATEQMALYLAMLDEAAAITDRAAQGMTEAFGRVGDSIGRLASVFASYAADREASQQRLNKLEKEGGKNTAAYIGAKNAQKAQDLDYYRSVASGAKAFFKEGSDGYKALAAAEKALAIIQLANTAKSVAAGAAKMFATLGPFAFPAVAAMVAVMAGLGFAGGGGASARLPSAQELQEAQGTGSVLGDKSAKSNSISRSLEIMSRNSNRDLEYSTQMVRSLRNIETGIGSLASALAKSLGLSGGAFDTSGFGLGTKTGISGFGFGAISTPILKVLSKIPVIGSIVGALFGSKTTTSLLDQGLTFDPQTVGSIIDGGINGSVYSDIETKKKKKFFGISTGTKYSYSTQTSDLDGGMENQIGLLIGSLRTSIVEAAGILGIEGAGAALDAFTINIGKISLKDLKGSEIQEQLEAVFSKIGDDMAAAAIPGIEAFQKVGEGLFETLARLAKDYITVDTALKSIGMTFGAVGASSVAAREELIGLFASLDDFVEQTSFFRDNFLSEAERIAPVASALKDELARLGLSGITTKEQFKSTVLGLDLTTETGRGLYASLLNIAPAFAKVSDYVDSLNKTMRDTFAETVEQFTGYADSLRKYRDTLFLTGKSPSNALAIARAKFSGVAGLAAQGNATALGQLEGVSKDFLDKSLANASSFQQYQRDVAAVAGAVDKGIFAAESTADYAQLQLDALVNSVDLLSSIDTNIAALVTPQVEPLTNQPAGLAPSNDIASAEMIEQMRLMQEQLAALAAQGTANAITNSSIQRLFTRWDGDGLLIRTDADTPIQTQVLP